MYEVREGEFWIELRRHLRSLFENLDTTIANEDIYYAKTLRIPDDAAAELAILGGMAKTCPLKEGVTEQDVKNLIAELVVKTAPPGELSKLDL